MSGNSTNEDIKNGTGLKPLPTNGGDSDSGTTTEQKSENSGIRRDTFTKNDDNKKTE